MGCLYPYGTPLPPPTAALSMYLCTLCCHCPFKKLRYVGNIFFNFLLDSHSESFATPRHACTHNPPYILTNCSLGQEGRILAERANAFLGVSVRLDVASLRTTLQHSFNHNDRAVFCIPCGTPVCTRIRSLPPRAPPRPRLFGSSRMSHRRSQQ